MVEKKTLVAYLQNMMDDFMAEKERYGMKDRIVTKKLDAMIACKEMVEAVICEPVNLQQDGRVAVEF